MLGRLCRLAVVIMMCSVQAWGTSYFLSPSGSDGNNGLSSGAPWLTPNHAVNCGDTITATTSTSYSNSNFNNGDWGTVSSCSGGNQVAWVICATFDACKINVTSGNSSGVWIDKSHWGIQGFESTTLSTNTGGACFSAGPATSGVVIHHIIFANNVANGCSRSGFKTFNSGTTGSVDYVAFIGNIAYNGAQGSAACESGISIYQPIASDTTAGTHLYVAGNYMFDNVDANPCAGGTPTDGEGVILDTFDFSQGGGTAYCQQAVAQNNLVAFNGGMGVEVFQNTTGGCSAPVWVKYNTAYGDMTDNNQTGGCLGRGEMLIKVTKNTAYDHNLAQTRTGTSCSSAPIFASFAETVDSSDVATNNLLFSAAGHSTGTDNAMGFSYASTTTTTPSLSNPVDPGAPSCGSFSSTAACMATVIANFTATAGGASAFGRQVVSNTSITDALFPAWLCAGTGVLNPNIPAGLITPGCGILPTGPSVTLSGHGTFSGNVVIK